jgi:hypothetical protein
VTEKSLHQQFSNISNQRSKIVCYPLSLMGKSFSNWQPHYYQNMNKKGQKKKNMHPPGIAIDPNFYSELEPEEL